MFLQSLMKFPQCFFKIIRKQYVMDTLSFGQTDGWMEGQRENSIPFHKHSLQGGIIKTPYLRIKIQKSEKRMASIEDQI